MNIIVILFLIIVLIIIIGNIDNSRPVTNWSFEKLERMLPKLRKAALAHLHAGNNQKFDDLSKKADEVSKELGKRIARRNAGLPENGELSREEKIIHLARIIDDATAKEIQHIKYLCQHDHTDSAIYILKKRIDIRMSALSNLGYSEKSAAERALFESLGILNILAIEDWPKLNEIDDFAERSGRANLAENILSELKNNLRNEELEMKQDGYLPIYEIHNKYRVNSSDLWAFSDTSKAWLDELHSANCIDISNSFDKINNWCLNSLGQEFFWYGSLDISGSKSFSERALYIKPGKLDAAKRVLEGK